jgi:hypothetical protein
MAETRSRRKGCPFCGHMHIYEVICTRFEGDNGIEIPSSMMMGRTPSFTRVLNSSGDVIDEETAKYGIEEEGEKNIEKQYFFDQPIFIARSRGFDGDPLNVIDIFWKCKQCLRTWSPVSEREFRKCPNCGMNSGISIMYGLPTYIGFKAISRGEVSTGGCCIDPCNPIWACKECGHEWGGLQNGLDHCAPQDDQRLIKN